MDSIPPPHSAQARRKKNKEPEFVTADKRRCPQITGRRTGVLSTDEKE
jgi:hypothetical protein